MTDSPSSRGRRHGDRPDRHRRRRRWQRRSRPPSSTSRAGASARSGCASPTPQPATPEAVSASIGRLDQAPGQGRPRSADSAPVGVGLPGVAMGGRLLTAAQHRPGVGRLPRRRSGWARRSSAPVSIVNDADAAGIAEMRFGQGAGKRGVVIFLTLGTGVGSGVFVDGVLVPNTEFGQMEIRGRPAERRSASAARVRRGLVVEGLGGRPRRAPPAHRGPDVADAVHPRRRRQQERRQVHPAPDPADADRGRQPAQRRRASSARRSWRPKAWPTLRRPSMTCRIGTLSGPAPDA